MTEQEKNSAGVINWTKDYEQGEEEKAYLLSMAMKAQGWNIDKVSALQIIETFEVVVAKGFEFSLKDAAQLEVEFDNIRNEQVKSSGEKAKQ